MLSDFTSWALGESPEIAVSGVKVIGKCSVSFDAMSEEERVRQERLHAELKRKKALAWARRKETGRTETEELAERLREPVRAFLATQEGVVFIFGVLRAIGVEHNPDVNNSVEQRAVGALLRELGWRPSRVKVNGKNTWGWVRA